MERISDYLKGYGEFNVKGANIPKLLDSIAENCLEIWGITPKDEYEISFKLHKKNFEAMEKLIEKQGFDFEIIREKGFLKSIKPLKKRYALWLLPIFLILQGIASLFIWKIDIVGNVNLSETEILNALSECGVYYGACHLSLESDEVRTKMELLLDEIKWLGIANFGSRIRVDLREKEEIPEQDQDEDAIKIVASEAGIITKIEDLRGFSLVDLGQSCIKGDTLITCAVPSTFDKMQIIRALGSVEARTWYEISALMPKTYEGKGELTEEKTKFALIFSNNRINFYSNSGILDATCDNIIYEENLGIDGIFSLPISLVKIKSQYYETITRYYSQEELEKALKTRLENELKRRIGEDGEIVSMNFSMGDYGDYALCTLRAECLQNIAKEVPMTLEEINEAKAAEEDAEGDVGKSNNS